MSGKFKNKYRISSARLQTWNYGNNAAYFITICTKYRQHFFGEIIDDKMELNEIGKITEQEWIITPELRPDMNLELGEFSVMPNHFHAILIIGENQYNTQTRRDAMHGVSTTTANQFGPQSKNLGSIIRGFKSSVTTQAKQLCGTDGVSDFAWQPRFHDHIFRDSESFERIQNYIANNEKNWTEDKFNS